MTIIEQIETHEHSATAAACEHAALYGATPERDEFDTRDVWDADDAIEAVSESFRILAQGVGPDGTQLATNARACCGASSTCSTPRPSASTVPPTS